MKFTTVLLLIATILCMAIPNAIKKKFKKDTPIFFSLVCVTTSLVFFVVKFLIENGFSINVDAKILIYAIPFGVCFALATLFLFLAFRYGDLSLTGLLSSFSLLLPTLYGVLFLGDKVGLFFWIGLALFIVCLVLTNIKFLDKNRERKPVSLKWAVFIIIGAVANGGCSIFQTMQQKAYGGTGGSELMIVALTFVFVVFLTIVLVTERKKVKPAFKSALVLGVPAGILNALLNALVMVFTGQNLVPVAIFFPLISGGSLLFTFLMGYFIYKEKYDWLQYVGILCGLLSVILLNL